MRGAMPPRMVARLAGSLSPANPSKSDTDAANGSWTCNSHTRHRQRVRADAFATCRMHLLSAPVDAMSYTMGIAFFFGLWVGIAL